MLLESEKACKVNKEVLDRLKGDHKISEVTFSLNSSKLTRGTLATKVESQQSTRIYNKEESLRSQRSAVGGLATCDICKDAIYNSKDIELNIRVAHMMRKEIRLRNLYNSFRKSRGLPATDFDALKTPNTSVTVQMCFICHLDAFASVTEDMDV